MSGIAIWMAFGKTTKFLDPDLMIPLRADVLANLRDLPFAPSVALQQVPKQSIGDILAHTSQDAQDDDSDLDERIQSILFPFHIFRF